MSLEQCHTDEQIASARGCGSDRLGRRSASDPICSTTNRRRGTSIAASGYCRCRNRATSVRHVPRYDPGRSTVAFSHVYEPRTHYECHLRVGTGCLSFVVMSVITCPDKASSAKRKADWLGATGPTAPGGRMGGGEGPSASTTTTRRSFNAYAARGASAPIGTFVVSVNRARKTTGWSLSVVRD